MSYHIDKRPTLEGEIESQNLMARTLTRVCRYRKDTRQNVDFFSFLGGGIMNDVNVFFILFVFIIFSTMSI